jgi:hypothetical protein
VGEEEEELGRAERPARRAPVILEMTDEELLGEATLAKLQTGDFDFEEFERAAKQTEQGAPPAGGEEAPAAAEPAKPAEDPIENLD